MRKKISIDGVLSFFMIAAFGYAAYILFNARSIPFNWRLISIALCTILTLLCFILTFKKMPSWAIWTRRVICVLLALSLGLGGFYLGKIGIFTSTVTDVKKEAGVKVSLVVKSDNKVKDILDLEGLTVGIENANDKENANFVKKQLEKDVDDITFISEENYLTLGQSLLDEDIDALIISDNFIPTIEEWQEGFTSQTKTIKTYTRSVINKVTSSTGNGLDLNKDCFTVLISGTDETGDPSHNSRSDVIMLVIVNPVTKQVQMVSFPRDSYIPNPALGYGYDKLTHTGNDGVENTMTAIENVVGFDIDFYVKVNFTSVVKIVDALGGIEVDSPLAFCEQDSERNFENLQCLEKGVQKVDGEKALAFARHRKSDGVGDIGRTHAQQKVLTAMINKALTAEGIAKIPDILDILPDYLVTNISEAQLENFISYQLENMGSWTINQLTLENGYSALLTTASMGSTPLDCYLLNRTDVKKLSALYYAIYNPSPLKDFAFDLNDLTYDETKAKYNSEIIYTDSDYSAHLGNTQEPVKEEEDTPTVETPVTPPVTKPDNGGEQEQPEEPTTPEVPSNPGGNGDNTGSGGTTNPPA